MNGFWIAVDWVAILFAPLAAAGVSELGIRILRRLGCRPPGHG